MWNQKPSIRLEVDNFSESIKDILKSKTLTSKTFVSGGCEWNITVNPGDVHCHDRLSLYLCAANYKSLQGGWKRRANYYFVLLNQSDKELFRTSIGQATFHPMSPGWGFKTLPLSKFQEEGFLEKDILIIEVYIKVDEVFDCEEVKEEEVEPEKKETVDVKGFQAFASQFTSVRKIFSEHVTKTEHVLSNACSKLSELAEIGSKMDWLKSKLEEVSLKMKKADFGSRAQQLEERVKNLEEMQSFFEMDVLKLRFQESLERFEGYAADGSPRVKNLEERVKNLELMELGLKLDCLEVRLEEVLSECKQSDRNNESQVQQQEERIKNIELMLLDLKAELDTEKAKSDEFFFVDEVA